jgi:hypothetical protein
MFEAIADGSQAPWARTQEELGLESPDLHLYERAPIGDEAHTSRHAPYQDENPYANVISE